MACHPEFIFRARAGMNRCAKAEYSDETGGPAMMTVVQPDEACISFLVARFIEICLEQYQIIYSLGSSFWV